MDWLNHAIDIWKSNVTILAECDGLIYGRKLPALEHQEKTEPRWYKYTSIIGNIERPSFMHNIVYGIVERRNDNFSDFGITKPVDNPDDLPYLMNFHVANANDFDNIKSLSAYWGERKRPMIPYAVHFSNLVNLSSWERCVAVIDRNHSTMIKTDHEMIDPRTTEFYRDDLEYLKVLSMQ